MPRVRDDLVDGLVLLEQADDRGHFVRVLDGVPFFAEDLLIIQQAIQFLQYEISLLLIEPFLSKRSLYLLEHLLDSLRRFLHAVSESVARKPKQICANMLFKPLRKLLKVKIAQHGMSGSAGHARVCRTMRPQHGIRKLWKLYMAASASNTQLVILERGICPIQVRWCRNGWARRGNSF